MSAPAPEHRRHGEKPTEVRTSTAHMQHNCAGNGGPCQSGHPKTKTTRSHAWECQKRHRQIRPGDEVRVAYWNTRPLLTIHCLDCAEKYLGEQRKPA